ncbi:MAG: hypothetical protein ACI30B_01725 [Paludibacteraceae bacterium]
MQYYNNILTVEARWLIAEGIMTEVNYRNLTNRKDIRIVRRGCRGQESLVDYESMPERFRRKVDAIVKDPYKAVRTNMIEEYIAHSAEASEYFDTFVTGDDRHLPSDKRREYYANAIVMDAIHTLIVNRSAKRRALGGKATRFWEEISQAVQDLDRTRFPHALPANARSLERKYKAYKADGYESLIHKTYIVQNKNAAKVLDDNQISALGVLISDPRNLDNEQVARIYNTLAVQMQWKKITAATVAVWRDKLDNETYARRHGAVAYRSKKAMQVKRSAPTCPLYYWTMDGWDAELMYRKEENGRTTYHNRLTVVFVLDACCKYPVGYAIGTHETPELIKEALRNAAKHTESLFGQMYRTAQLQSDNYAIKKMMPVYTQMAEKATPAQVKNAKAKIIEPWFRYFNKKYCQLQPNWSGFGVTSRKDLQPNSDFLNKYRKNFPDFEGVCQQIIAFIEAERAELRDKYVSLFNEMPSENRFPLSYDQYLMLFGATTGNRNLLQGSGLNITIGGVKRTFDCFDPAFRNHASVRWEVRFDPDDLSRTLAVNEDESLRFMLEEKYVQPMALIERKEGDYEQLRRVLDFNKKQEKDIAGTLGGYMEHTAELMAHNKELDTLQKLMICDSRGQHKDQRNKERLHLDISNDNVFDTNDLLDEY